MSVPKTIVIASRESPLAVRQAEMVIELLEQTCRDKDLSGDYRFVLKTYKTTGDIRLSGSLADIGGKGLFIKEIEQALLSKEADIAVHSMKDMPVDLPSDLVIAAVPAREDPRDSFISSLAETPWDLPQGAVVGTASVRRAAQVLNRRPDLKIVPLRGNVGTRLKKLEEKQADATFLAEAGLKRLGQDDVKRTIMHPQDMLPALGQGVLCVQCRREDEALLELVRSINCHYTELCVAMERAFQGKLDGSCRTPMAGLAVISNETSLTFSAQLLSTDGKEVMDWEETIILPDNQIAAIQIAVDKGAFIGEKLFHRAPESILESFPPGSKL